MQFLYPLGAVAIGMTIALQPAVNGTSARILGSSVAAAVISVAITLVCLLVALPLFGVTIRPAALAALPWWIVLGGVVGAGIVAGGAAIAPVIGVALFIVCLLVGQLAASALIDHVGAFGMTVRPLSLMKAAGLVVALVGALMVRAG